ncbi:hypothetical protein K2Z84_22170 [Candidatus Binatia bacterium]|jgi:hypothetical protein|nr:hypothetical protein [Candidatus Binatia bacterium]
MSRTMVELHRAEILRRADLLRAQYPAASCGFLACSLAYEIGLRPDEIEAVLVEEEGPGRARR